MARHREAREVLVRTALTEAWRRLRLSLPPPAEASAAQEDHRRSASVPMVSLRDRVWLGLAAAQRLIYKASPPILPNTGITSKTNSLIWVFIIASKSAYFHDGQCWQKCNFLLLTKRRKNKYTGGKIPKVKTR